MRVSRLRLLGAAVLTALLTSCPETSVPDNFGSSAVKLKSSEWEGKWHPADEPKEFFTLHVRDASKGTLEFRIANEHEPSKKPEIYTLTLRETGAKSGGNLHFAILKDTAKSDDGTLHLIRPAKDDAFLLWSINSEAVTTALKSGELWGSIQPDEDGTHNRLNADPRNYAALLAPRFWKWTEPSLLLRSR
jgi:hypothetical protein